LKKFKSIELFSGAGGLAIGLHYAGCQHVALIERDKDSCITLKNNIEIAKSPYKNWKVINSDVSSIDYSCFTSKNINLIAGGPPCQPFSMGGKHKGNQDKRDMFPEAVRAVKEVKPLIFIFENVKGLLRRSFATYYNYIILQLTYPSIARRNNESWVEHLSRLEKIHTSNKVPDISYKVIYRLLNAADYGVPQIRNRVFIVGVRSDINLNWSFPEPTNSLDGLLFKQWVSGEYWENHKVSRKHIPAMPAKFKKRIEQMRVDYVNTACPFDAWLTVRDAIGDLPDPRKKNNVLNHEFRDGAKIYPGHTGSLLDEPSKALKAGDHGVPGGENMVKLSDGSVRYYTVRESARIQTFPDDYVFSISWTESMRQLGNAVPVKLAEVVGKSVIKSVGEII